MFTNVSTKIERYDYLIKINTSMFVALSFSSMTCFKIVRACLLASLSVIVWKNKKNLRTKEIYFLFKIKFKIKPYDKFLEDFVEHPLNQNL